MLLLLFKKKNVVRCCTTTNITVYFAISTHKDIHLLLCDSEIQRRENHWILSKGTMISLFKLSKSPSCICKLISFSTYIFYDMLCGILHRNGVIVTLLLNLEVLGLGVARALRLNKKRIRNNQEFQ